MSDGRLTDKWVEKYWQSVRKHVHQLISWGYMDARQSLTCDLEEEDITGRLVESIQERLRSPSSPSWCVQYAVKENNPVPGLGLSGNRRKRPDMIIECTKGRRPEYVFEAKPIRVRRYPVSHYLGADSLQRFLREEYAARYSEGGMLGYVQSDSVPVWTQKIRAAIDGDARRENRLRVKSPPRNVEVIADFPDEWVSEHERASGYSGPVKLDS